MGTITIDDFYKLDKKKRMKLFFETAEKVGLIKNGHYISGIPKGNEKDINTFYMLEDCLEYPEPQKVK